MRFYIILFLLIINYFHNSLSYPIIIFIIYVYEFYRQLDKKIAFVEFIMVLYSLNFLLSPAIVYFNNDSDLVFYKMKIGKVVYFQLVIPAILLLDLGLNLKKIDIFKPDISVLKLSLIHI